MPFVDQVLWVLPHFDSALPVIPNKESIQEQWTHSEHPQQALQFNCKWGPHTVKILPWVHHRWGRPHRIILIEYIKHTLYVWAYCSDDAKVLCTQPPAQLQVNQWSTIPRIVRTKHVSSSNYIIWGVPSVHDWQQLCRHHTDEWSAWSCLPVRHGLLWPSFLKVWKCSLKLLRSVLSSGAFLSPNDWSFFISSSSTFQLECS